MKEKKKVLLVSFIGVCILVLLFLLGTTSCYRNEVCNQIDKSIPDSNIFIEPISHIPQQNKKTRQLHKSRIVSQFILPPYRHSPKVL